MRKVDRAKKQPADINEIADRLPSLRVSLRELFATDDQFRAVWQALVAQLAAPGAINDDRLDAVMGGIADYVGPRGPQPAAPRDELEWRLAIVLIEDVGLARGDDPTTIANRRMAMATGAARQWPRGELSVTPSGMDRSFERRPTNSAYYRQLSKAQGAKLAEVLQGPPAAEAFRAAVEAQHRNDVTSGVASTQRLIMIVKERSPALYRDLGEAALRQSLVLAVSEHVQLERGVAPAAASAQVQELAADSKVRVNALPELPKVRAELGQKAPRGAPPVPYDEKLADREFFLRALDEKTDDAWKVHHRTDHQVVAYGFGLEERSFRLLLGRHGIDWRRWLRSWKNDRSKRST